MESQCLKVTAQAKHESLSSSLQFSLEVQFQTSSEYWL